VNLFGHSNPRINAALREQLDNLEQVILAGFYAYAGHRPVGSPWSRFAAHRD